MNGNWIAIGHIDDIPLRGARVVKAPGGDIAVFVGPGETLTLGMAIGFPLVIAGSILGTFRSSAPS